MFGLTPAAASARTGYIALNGGTPPNNNQIRPFDTATNALGAPIPLGAGSQPRNLAITPDGKTAWVVRQGNDTVVSVDLATATVGTPIPVGSQPVNIAMAPNGARAYVTDFSENNVRVIDTSNNSVAATIPTGQFGANNIAVTPDGTTAFVVNQSSGSVTPIDLGTNTAGAPLVVGGAQQSIGIAITPDGATAYATATGSVDAVRPIDVASRTVGAPIPVGNDPNGIAIAPDGRTAYVANNTSGSVSVIDTSTDTVVATIPAIAQAFQPAFAPDGAKVFVTQAIAPNGTFTPIDTATGTAGTPSAVIGETPRGIAITPDQGPVAAFTEAPGTAGSPTTFDASGSTDSDGTVARYDWDFGDGTVLADGGPTPSHTYAEAGDYTVKLTVTDNEGCSTDFVFTGQTAYCNAGPQGRTQHAVSVSRAPDPPPEPSAGELALSGPKKQKLGPTVEVGALCNFACAATGKGRLHFAERGGGRRDAVRRRPPPASYPLDKSDLSLASLEPGTLEVAVPRRTRRAAKRAIERRHLVIRAELTVNAKGDPAGALSKARTVKLKLRP